MKIKTYHIEKWAPNTYQVRRLRDGEFDVIIDLASGKVHDAQNDSEVTDEVNLLRAKRVVLERLKQKLPELSNGIDFGDLSPEEVKFMMSEEEFWGDITDTEMVAKAKEFIWNNMTVKMRASAVFQANREQILAQRNMENPDRKILKPDRPEFTKKVIGVAMSFVFEE